MMCTSTIDGQDTVNGTMIDNFLVDAAWAIHSTYHTVLKCSPGQDIFGRDMLFDIPYIADWTEIGRCRQTLVDKSNVRENSSRLNFDYQPVHRVLVRKDGILRKAETKYKWYSTDSTRHSLRKTKY